MGILAPPHPDPCHASRIWRDKIPLPVQARAHSSTTTHLCQSLFSTQCVLFVLLMHISQMQQYS
jgi:hypothetical protein